MRAPEFWDKGGGLSILLSPLGAGYGIAGRLRRAMSQPARVPIPVVCVGNLVAGGAGKTPMVLSLLAALKVRGLMPHALTLGYGGRETGPLRIDPTHHDAGQVGDEALLLAAAAPTWVARDRVAGAQAIVEAGANVIVMDDGFQNPTVAKDISLLVVDGAYGFGNGRLIPAGPLREPVRAGVARADAIVLLEPDAQDLAAALSSRRPVLRARLTPTADGQKLAGKRVLAFAGIGRPEKFFATLDALGVTLVGCRAFPDHHPYRQSEIDEVVTRAESLEAIAVTTEKDAVRLPAPMRARVQVLPITVDWLDQAGLESLLNRIVGLAEPER